MKKTSLLASIALRSAATAAATIKQNGTAGALPLHHDPKIRAQAASQLGLDENERNLQSSPLQQLQQQPIQGSCSYFDDFTGETACMQFQGMGWSDDDMNGRCSLSQEKGSVFIAMQGCAEEGLAGWCDTEPVDGNHEVIAMVLSALSGCTKNQMTCEQLMSGTFVAVNSCLPASEEIVEQMEYAAGSEEAEETNSKSVLEVSDRLTVESCYDESTNTMDISVHFHDIEATSDGLLPWMSIGYRASELCTMIPLDGGAAPIVLVTQENEGEMPGAHKTMLLPKAKEFSDDVFSSMYSLMEPLDEVDAFSSVSVEAPMILSSTADIKIARSSLSMANEDTVSIHFKQFLEDKPKVMNLMYAIGMNSKLGVHSSRGCFKVNPKQCENVEPDLSAKKDVEAAKGDPTKSSTTTDEDSVSVGEKSTMTIIVFSMIGMLVLGFGVAFIVIFSTPKTPRDDNVTYGGASRMQAC